MHSSLLIAALLASGAFAGPIAKRTSPYGAVPTSCASGVHIIAARGSTDAPGEGPLQNVSTAIEAVIPGSDDYAVVYPADLIPYESSEESGVKNLTAEVIAYVQECPDTKIVLLGYSQGAQLVGDMLGGGSFSDTPPIDSSYTTNIIAAVQFGDPAHVPGKSYDAGTGTKNGLFPRKNTAVLDTYADILQSWCDNDDIVCDSGLSLKVHEEEVPTNAAAAVQYILSNYQKFGSS